LLLATPAFVVSQIAVGDTGSPSAPTLAARAETSTFAQYAPCRITYELRNNGDAALPLALTFAGLPAQLELHLQDSLGKRRTCSIAEVEDQSFSFLLRTGESLQGTCLVGVTPEGFFFRELGEFRATLVLHTSDADLRSEEFRITVVPSAPSTEHPLRELSRIALKRQGVSIDDFDLANRQTLAETYALTGELLAELARCDRPHLVDPSRSARDRRDSEMVEELRKYVESFPDGPYCTIVARFVGLVDLKTFEHSVSRENHDRLKSGLEPIPVEALRVRTEYRNATRYLLKAAEAQDRDWIATYNLALGYELVHDNEKVDSILTIMEQNPAAKELAAGIRKSLADRKQGN
jgi:hypothetical protein